MKCVTSNASQVPIGFHQLSSLFHCLLPCKKFEKLIILEIIALFCQKCRLNLKDSVILSATTLFMYELIKFRGNFHDFQASQKSFNWNQRLWACCLLPLWALMQLLGISHKARRDSVWLFQVSRVKPLCGEGTTEGLSSRCKTNASFVCDGSIWIRWSLLPLRRFEKLPTIVAELDLCTRLVDS